MSLRRSARLVLNRLTLLGLGCTLCSHAAWTTAQEPSPVSPSPYVPVYLAVPPAGPALAQPPAASSLDFDPGAPWEHVTREPRKVSSKSEGDWGSWTSQITWQDGRTGIWDEPLLKRTW